MVALSKTKQEQETSVYQEVREEDRLSPELRRELDESLVADKVTGETPIDSEVTESVLDQTYDSLGGSDRYLNGQRTSKYHELTDTEIASLKNDIRDIGADESIFRFNKGYQTGYSDKKGLIYVKGDVLPDVTSTHP